MADRQPKAAIENLIELDFMTDWGGNYKLTSTAGLQVRNVVRKFSGSEDLTAALWHEEYRKRSNHLDFTLRNGCRGRPGSTGYNKRVGAWVGDNTHRSAAIVAGDLHGFKTADEACALIDGQPRPRGIEMNIISDDPEVVGVRLRSRYRHRFVAPLKNMSPLLTRCVRRVEMTRKSCGFTQ